MKLQLWRNAKKFSKKQLMYRYAVYPFFRSPFAYIYKILRYYFQPMRYVSSILQEDFAKNTRLAERVKPKMTTFSSAKRIHYDGLMNPLITSAMEMMNIFSKQFRLENRSPFFDRRVMEYCLALPAQQKAPKWMVTLYRQAGLEGCDTANSRGTSWEKYFNSWISK